MCPSFGLLLCAVSQSSIRSVPLWDALPELCSVTAVCLRYRCHTSLINGVRHQVSPSAYSRHHVQSRQNTGMLNAVKRSTCVRLTACHAMAEVCEIDARAYDSESQFFRRKGC